MSQIRGMQVGDGMRGLCVARVGQGAPGGEREAWFGDSTKGPGGKVDGCVKGREGCKMCVSGQRDTGTEGQGRVDGRVGERGLPL